jgi:cytochrome c5
VLVAGLAVLVIGLILTLAGWRAGWWFAAQNATRQYQVTQNGTSNQHTLRDQISSKLADVASITVQLATAPAGQQPALKAQRAAIAGIACSDAGQVTGVPLPPDQAQWASRNCSAGTLSPGSPLYANGS